MPSLYMPDVVVEVAFNAGYVTPAASRVWTDISPYVELKQQIAMTLGRQDERSTADANSLTLTLDNTDGRFTAGRAASPYSPNVKIGRPIRVRVTPPGGTTVTRFVGFIDEWPVEWDGTDAYAMAKVRASSRLSRLGLTAKLRSMMEEEVLSTPAPKGYWTLGDPAGALQASESSGNNAPPLTVVGTGAAVVFGNATGPGTDGLTAAEFAAGQYLSAGVPGGQPRAMRAAVQVTTLPASTATVMSITVPALGSAGTTSITLSTAGVISIPAVGTSLGITGPTLSADGSVHDVVYVWTETTGTLYVDGVSAGTNGGFPTAAGQAASVLLGEGLTGVLSHAAWFSSDVAALSAGDVAGMWSAITGFKGDRTDQRALRLLDWVGVASTEVTIQTGVETMTYQQTSGMSVVDALRECESTEGGVLFDGPDGNVQFHNRSNRYLKTPAATLNFAAQHIGADYAPKLDRSALVNDVEVRNPTTGQTARAASTTSSDEYGVATGSATSVANSYDPLVQKASWLIASYAEPRTRVPSLTVDVLAHQGLTPSAQTLLGVTVGDVLAVTNAPMQAETSSTSYFVEGYTETIGPESYEITYNLSPSNPTLNTLVLDSATRGLLDTGVLAL